MSDLIDFVIERVRNLETNLKSLESQQTELQIENARLRDALVVAQNDSARWQGICNHLNSAIQSVIEDARRLGTEPTPRIAAAATLQIPEPTPAAPAESPQVAPPRRSIAEPPRLAIAEPVAPPPPPVAPPPPPPAAVPAPPPVVVTVAEPSDERPAAPARVDLHPDDEAPALVASVVPAASEPVTPVATAATTATVVPEAEPVAPTPSWAQRRPWRRAEDEAPRPSAAAAPEAADDDADDEGRSTAVAKAAEEPKVEAHPTLFVPRATVPTTAPAEEPAEIEEKIEAARDAKAEAETDADDDASEAIAEAEDDESETTGLAEEDDTVADEDDDDAPTLMAPPSHIVEPAPAYPEVPRERLARVVGQAASAEAVTAFRRPTEPSTPVTDRLATATPADSTSGPGTVSRPAPPTSLPAVKGDAGQALAGGAVVEVVAQPFASFSALRQFVDSVRALPPVRNVRLRQFDKGTLQLRVEHSGEGDLPKLLGSMPDFPGEVQPEGDARLLVTLAENAGVPQG
ncbi:MAG: hypothetical protein U0821_18070 [Chloroflexota bacterium]